MEFQTNEALVRWMEDEGLSPFTLLKVSPKPSAKPKKVPASVVMEWGVLDLDYEGEREKFRAWRVTAEEVEVFRCEGILDRFEECNTEVGEGTNIDLRLEAGGALLLRCGRLVVSDEPVERFRKGQPRPHHGEFILQLELSTLTWSKLREHLGIPPEFTSLQHPTLTPLAESSRPSDARHLMIVDGAGHDQVWLRAEDQRVRVARGKWLADELWAAIWAKGRIVPGVTRISSRDLVSTAAEWPEAPPPKPAPQVWPHVYAVGCDFAELTLDDLRACLELPLRTSFVFEGANAPEPQARLTLGEAARHGGGNQATGVFQDENGKVLVRCRADLRERVLSFTRERDCPDATWLAVWRAPERLPNVRERRSRTTQSPPDPWPPEPPR